jgi:hypothetical protein
MLPAGVLCIGCSGSTPALVLLNLPGKPVSPASAAQHLLMPTLLAASSCKHVASGLWFLYTAVLLRSPLLVTARIAAHLQLHCLLI